MEVTRILAKEDNDKAVARLKKRVRPAVPLSGASSLVKRRQALALMAALSAEKALKEEE